MAVDYFLKIDGVDGESTVAQHKGEIQLDSFSWGQARPASGGGGGGAGKVQMQDFHFVMKTSKASPKLFLACATGEHFKKALLSVRKAGNQTIEFLKITLADVMVSSFQLGSDANDNIPLEQVSFSFSKIEWSYSSSGGGGPSITAGYDLTSNKAV